MRTTRFIFCLFIIGLLFGCSGSTGTGGTKTSGKLGKVLADDLQVTTNTDDQTQPHVTYDTDNNKYLVVWTDYRDLNSTCSGQLCGTDIYGKFCTGTGTGNNTTMACENDFLISNVSGASAPGHQSQPKVSYDRLNKKYLVIWTDSRNGSYTQIWGQYVNQNGSLLGSNTPITPHVVGAGGDAFSPYGGASASYLSQSEPDLIFDETLRRFVVAWLDESNSDSANTFPLAAMLGCSNSNYGVNYIPIPQGVDYNLIRTGEIDGSKTLATAQNILDYSQLVFTEPFTFGSATSISAAFRTMVDETHPKLFYNKATGEYFVTWQGREAKVDFSQTFKTEDNIVDRTSVVSAPAFPGWVVGMPVTTLSSTNPTDITATDGLGTEATISVAGNVITLGGPVSVGAELLPITVSYKESIGLSCSFESPKWSPTDTDKIQKVKIRKTTTIGATLITDLSFGTSTHGSFNPSVNTDQNTARALLTWEETGASADKDIVGYLLDMTNFTSYSNAISLSNSLGDQSLSFVSFDNVNQRFLVLWEDARNQSANISNADVYGQFVDPQGNLSGANFPVTFASGNQIAPAASFGDVDFRKFFVVWKDGRDPGNSDIYGQLLEFSLGPQLLITDENKDPILTSSIDFGNVNVAENSVGVDKGIKICNNGNSQLTINSMTDPDLPFSFKTPLPVTISPGICYDITVNFKPIAAGSFSGTMINNFRTTIDSDGGKIDLFFNGSGVGAIQPLKITTTSLTDGSVGAAYSLTLNGFGGVYPYTWALSSGSLPAGLTLNEATGRISGTPLASGNYTFTVRLSDKSGTQVTREYTIKVTAVVITTTGLKNWTQGIEYSNAPLEALKATGGTGSYTWSISDGSLPTGLSLNSSTGAISGVPSASGVFSFAVTVTEGSGEFVSKGFSITINPPPTITTTSLFSGIVNSGYSETLEVAGGTPSSTWTIQSGALPPGLSIDNQGIIKGTPTSKGTYPFTVKVTDSAGATATKELTITVGGGDTNNETSNSGGGCTIGPRQNLPTSVADSLVMFMPLLAIALYRGLRRRNK